MNLLGWRTKALAQQVFSVVPGGHRLNYLFQAKVTHGLPISDGALDEYAELAGHHLEVVREVGDVAPEEARFFEFGGGWDLGMALALRARGVNHQCVVDIRPLVKESLVRDVASRLEARRIDAGWPNALRWLPSEPMEAFLRRQGIDYRAPCDARSTGLPADSIDYVTSTNTLEHIPADDIKAILAECHRLLVPGGALSFQIDYQDHFSYFEPAIGPYHFLRYSDRRWRIFNSGLHYQNRLRHRDHMALLRNAGFTLVREVLTPPSAGDLELLRGSAPHPTFDHYTEEDLTVRGSRIAARRAATEARPPE